MSSRLTSEKVVTRTIEATQTLGLRAVISVSFGGVKGGYLQETQQEYPAQGDLLPKR